MAAIPGTLYRRLAEVIDGLRTGRNTWFALALDFPHDPLTSTSGETGFGSQEDAEIAVSRTEQGPDGYGVFGPCKTNRESNRLAVTSITTQDVDGKSETGPPHPDVDLVCWSMSAFDKFVVPYYFQLYGRNEIAYDEIMAHRRRMKESGIFAHKWPTKGSNSIDAFFVFSPFK